MYKGIKWDVTSTKLSDKQMAMLISLADKKKLPWRDAKWEVVRGWEAVVDHTV